MYAPARFCASRQKVAQRDGMGSIEVRGNTTVECRPIRPPKKAWLQCKVFTRDQRWILGALDATALNPAASVAIAISLPCRLSSGFYARIHDSEVRCTQASTAGS